MPENGLDNILVKNYNTNVVKILVIVKVANKLP